MPDEWDDDSEQNEGQQSKGGGLRKQLETALAELKKAKDENVKLSAAVRKNTVATVLKDKGLDADIAELIPTDVEPTADAVGAWVDKFGKFFVKPAETPVEDEGQKTPDGYDQDDENEMLASQRMSQVTNGAQAPGKQADLMKQIASAKSADDIVKLIEAAGGGSGSG